MRGTAGRGGGEGAEVCKSKGPRRATEGSARGTTSDQEVYRSGSGMWLGRKRTGSPKIMVPPDGSVE
jgi:hypothetical protein